MAIYAVKLNDSNSVLNLRAAPSTSATILAKIPHGATVSEIGSYTGSDWKFVQYGSYSGYVSTQYIVMVSASNSTNSNQVNNNIINPNPNNMALTLTESTKKKIKIGLIVGGVAIAGYVVYRMTKKPKQQQAVSQGTSTALSGVGRSKKGKKGKKKTKAKKSKQKKIRLT